MADQYLVLPAHYVAGLNRHESAQAAAVSAARETGKDRAARVVVRVHAEVRADPAPKVDIVQIAEVANG